MLTCGAFAYRPERVITGASQAHHSIVEGNAEHMRRVEEMRRRADPKNWTGERKAKYDEAVREEERWKAAGYGYVNGELVKGKYPGKPPPNGFRGVHRMDFS